MITTTALIVLYIGCVFLSLKWDTFRKWFEPTPYPIIINGEIIYAGLTKARITIDHLLSELRKEKIEDVQKVALAQWEPDGTISFSYLPSNKHRPLKTCNWSKKHFHFKKRL